MADKQLKKSTLDAYNKRLITIAKKCGYDKVPDGDISLWLGEYFEDLIDQERLHNAKSLCNCILFFTEDGNFREKVKDKRYSIVKSINETHKKVEQIERRLKWTKVEELQQIFDNFMTLFDDKISRDVFIILFYTFPFHDSSFPMFRNELQTLIYGPYQSDGKNYYNGENIFLNKKKSNRSEIHAKIIEVPDELQNIFSIWMKSSNIKEGDLIINISTNRMSQVLVKHLGVGTMILRKIYDDFINSK
jgi:hypothetical protein